jgi:hypothetical protein
MKITQDYHFKTMLNYYLFQKFKATFGTQKLTELNDYFIRIVIFVIWLHTIIDN